MASYVKRLLERAGTTRGVVVPVTVVVLSIAGLYSEASAQKSGNNRRVEKIRIWAAGLPADAKVNPTMFSGIELTPAQGKKIAELAEKFSAEEAAREAGNPNAAPLDSAAKVKLLPRFEKQRLAYRAVLRLSQQEVYDQNTKQILDGWLRSRPAANTTSTR